MKYKRTYSKINLQQIHNLLSCDLFETYILKQTIETITEDHLVFSWSHYVFQIHNRKTMHENNPVQLKQRY